MASRPFTIVEVLYILHTLILRFSLLKVRYIPARQSYLQSQGEVRGLPSTTIIFFLSFSAFNFPEILLGLGRGGVPGPGPPGLYEFAVYIYIYIVTGE